MLINSFIVHMFSTPFSKVSKYFTPSDASPVSTAHTQYTHTPTYPHPTQTQPSLTHHMQHINRMRINPNLSWVVLWKKYLRENERKFMIRRCRKLNLYFACQARVRAHKFYKFAPHLSYFGMAIGHRPGQYASQPQV